MGRPDPAHLALCIRAGPFTLSGCVVPFFNHLVSCRAVLMPTYLLPSFIGQKKLCSTNFSFL